MQDLSTSYPPAAPLTRQPVAGESGAARPGRWRGAAWPLRAAWPLPMLVMFVMARWGVAGPRMWRDEAATWSAASRSVHDLGQLAGRIDAVITPYYLFMHYWIRVFGTTETVLRMPSVLAMTGAAGLTALIGKRLFGPAAGVAAGLLFAFIPSVSRYGQEARPYAIATFAAALATLLLVNALTGAKWRWLWWAAYPVALGMLGLSHLVTLVVLGGHGAAVAWWLWRTRDRHALWWLLACPIGLLPMLALLGPARRQQQAQIGGLVPPGWRDLLTLPAEVFQSGMVAGLVVGLAALAPWLAGGRDAAAPPARRDPVRGLGLVLLIGAGPGSFLLLWLISQVKSYWFTRYLLFTTPAWALLAGAALVGMRVGHRQLALLTAAVVAVAGLGAQDQLQLRKTLSHDWFNYPYPLPGWAPPLSDYRQAAHIMKANQQPGDVMLYANRRGWQALVMEYELRDGERPADVLLASSASQAKYFWGDDCTDVAKCFGTPQRAWLLAVGTPADPQAGMPKARSALLRPYRPLRTWRIDGMTLVLYSR